MTKVTFYNGLREIGGTFVAVETEKAICMFDYGFAVAGRLDKAMKIRKNDYAADYVRLGMLTGFDGIFEKETAEKIGKKAFGEVDKEMFFIISHMHIDHMGGLGCLHPDVPVYMSKDSLKLYKRIARMGEAEHRPHTNCIGVGYNESFDVGDINVKVIAVDHDVKGACGYLITTTDGTICYTGDYRLHGFHPEVTMNFANTVKGTDILITEGVTVSNEDVDMLSLTEPEEPQFTEDALQNYVIETCKEKDGLIIINPYNRNVERIHRLINSVKSTGRTLVLDPIAADYVNEFYPEDNIYVYENIMEESPAVVRNSCASWKLVSREEIIDTPEKFVLQLDYKYMLELIDIHDIVSQYIHMDGAPLGAYDPSFEKLKSFLASYGIEYAYKSTGGHSKPYYLRTVIDTIEPKTLIPLHSFRPEQVQSAKAGQRILPEYGQTVTLENGKVK